PCPLFFLSRRRRHTRFSRDWSSDVCSSDLSVNPKKLGGPLVFWTPEMGQTFTTTSTGEPLTLEVVPRFIYPGERVIATARGEAGTVLFDWGDGEATS